MDSPASGVAAGLVGFLAILLIRNDIIGAFGVGLIVGVFTRRNTKRYLKS
ncbi:MAG TPA: hypothetical protein VIH34_03380 [Candidatus Bathyarchaeia archaeon]